jgi:hypothetical protein
MRRRRQVKAYYVGHRSKPLGAARASVKALGQRRRETVGEACLDAGKAARSSASVVNWQVLPPAGA